MSDLDQIPLPEPRRLPRLTFDEHRGVPIPDWESFYAELDAAEWPADTLRTAVLDWAERVAACFDEPLRIYDGGFIVIVAGDRGPRIAEISGRVTAALGRFLGDAGAPAEVDDPHFVIDVPSHDEFVDVLDSYYGDRDGFVQGQTAISTSGTGYWHIVLPPGDDELLEETLAHQLCVTYLREHDAPLWLMQGLTDAFLERYFEQEPFWLDVDRKREHLARWDESTIQSFWSGETFDQDIEDDGLSYELAQAITIKIMCRHGERFADFLRAARVEDSGGDAAIEVLGTPLATFVAEFLGDGDWDPR